MENGLGDERMVLDTIKGPEDVKRLNEEERKELAAEIREFLIETTSRTGGHLASNLGVVELTIAMFCALNLPKDKIIWDVGHQSYTHKILSGRKDNFDGLRQYGGLSGFPKRKESPFDAFDTGHSSTSISAGLGMAQGRDLLVMLREQGKQALLVDDYSEMELVGAEPVEIPERFPFYSLVNITGTARGITETGCKFPLDNGEIHCGYQYGTSNEVLPGQIAVVSVKEGLLLLIKDFPEV